MKNLVIFGERPGPNTDPERPLHIHTSTGAAERLRRLLDFSVDEYYETKRYNVANDRNGKTTDPETRQRVFDIMHRHWREDLGTKFLFLGRAAATAAPRQFRGLEFGEPHSQVMVIPHPSGRNRYYNSQANITFIEQSLRKFVRGT